MNLNKKYIVFILTVFSLGHVVAEAAIVTSKCDEIVELCADEEDSPCPPKLKPVGCASPSSDGTLATTPNTKKSESVDANKPPPSNSSGAGYHGDTKTVAGVGRDTTANDLNDVNVAGTQVEKIPPAALKNVRKRLEVLDRGTSSNDPTQIGKIQNDKQIYQTVDDLYKNKKKVSRDLVELAEDPKIRKNLMLVSVAQEYRKELVAESTRLAAQLAELSRIAMLAGNRGTAMGSIPESNTKILPNSNSVEVAILANAEVASEEDPQISEMESKLKDPKLSEKDKKLLQAKLKDRLRKKLAERAKKDAAKKAEALTAAGNHFNGKLGAESVDPENKIGSAISEAGVGAVDAVLKTAHAETPFGMSGAETDASVRQIVSDAEREFASAGDGSVLTAETASLFERIRTAHRKCVSRECVRLN